MLLDHFHPPLSSLRHWESFHARWAAAIADALNRDLLPPDYFAEVQVHVGSRVEIDVASFELRSASADFPSTATLRTKAWSPPAPAMFLPAVFPDSLEVLVLSSESGPTLVAAIELVSPGNKDRGEHRRAFSVKCASYLQQGVGLLVADIVTSRQANLHNELIGLMGAGGEYRLPSADLYAASYRPTRTDSSESIAVWTAPLEVGRPLPTLPLPLDKQLCIPLDLGAAYDEACQQSRLA
ncbi:MAG: DUF4058 family protein [Pirellulales bacterium]